MHPGHGADDRPPPQPKPRSGGQFSWNVSSAAFPAVALRTMAYGTIGVLRRFEIHPGREGNIVTLGGLRHAARDRLASSDRAKRGKDRQALQISEHRSQESLEGADRFHPGLSHLQPHQGLVGAGLSRGLHLVRHHRRAQHHPVGSGRRRPETFPSAAVELTGQLEPDRRFPALHRFFRAPARLSGQDRCSWIGPSA